MKLRAPVFLCKMQAEIYLQRLLNFFSGFHLITKIVNLHSIFQKKTIHSYTMKQRTIDYMARKKAQTQLRHPGDLRSFLIAEYNASRSIVVKKDILKMLDKMPEQQEEALVEA